MQHISSHMSDRGKKKDRASERGEIMQYFVQALNRTRLRDGLVPITMGRMGKILEAIPTKDLYYLRSICDDAEKRGDRNSFSKRFWWEVNPKKHATDSDAPPPPQRPLPKKIVSKPAPPTRDQRCKYNAARKRHPPRASQ